MDAIIVPQWKSDVEAAQRSIDLLERLMPPEDSTASMLRFVRKVITETVTIAEKAELELAQLPWANDEYGQRLRQAMQQGFHMDKAEARALMVMISERAGISANFTSISQDNLKLLVGAAVAVEQWWLSEQMHKEVGAPGCIYALRAALEELRKA